ncbi:hypothetical protein [Brachyspira pilosicoli]|uniref:hypothetical protein n=1 Tax=Brachyspira pilosicoli TaxID=52584 RepID=UPI0026663EFE|nr:hypothetical protein [Brachyspira pilosicoli]
MKDDRSIILSSKELYALKKNSNSSLISQECGTSLKNYHFSISFLACILFSNKNKALYRFLYILKFVKIINFKI